MTPLEITAVALAVLNQLMNLLDLQAKIQRGELDPATLTPQDLIPETAEQILARVRAEESAPHA